MTATPAGPRPAPGPERFRDPGTIVALCGALVVAWWRLAPFVPRPAGESGWIFALHQARVDGLRAGSDVMFTYGPLAWLAFPWSLSRGEIGLGVALWFAVALGFLTALHASLRTIASPPRALLATAGVAATLTVGPAGAIGTIGTVAALLYVTRTLPPAARTAFPVVTGMLAATFLLVKFPSGTLVGLVGTAAIVSLPERRLPRLATFCLSSVVALVVLWLISQGQLDHLLEYIRHSLEFGRGYAGAMGFEASGYEPEYALAALISAALLTALARLRRARIRWLFILAVVVVLWASFRQGFVRHDGHSAQFFAIAAALSITLAVLQRSALLAVAGCLSLVAQAASIGGSVADLDPSRGVRSFAEAITMVASDGFRRTTNRAARLEVRRWLNLSPELLDAIGRHTVYVEPFHEHAAWAYGLRLRPLPTLQSYAAYSNPLDELNARVVRDENAAPEAILRPDNGITLDGRYLLWDPPRTQFEVICRYRIVTRAGGWSVLIRSTNRCGPTRRLAERDYAAREPIAVPQVDNGIVLATVRPMTGLAHALASLLFKPPNLMVQVDGRSWRLPWGHVGTPLVVSVIGADDFKLGGAPVVARQLRLAYPARVVFEAVSIAP